MNRVKQFYIKCLYSIVIALTIQIMKRCQYDTEGGLSTIVTRIRIEIKKRYKLNTNI